MRFSRLSLSVAVGLCTGAAFGQQYYSVTVLHPNNASLSFARGIYNRVAVGEAYINGSPTRAPMWTGPGNNYVDLAPATSDAFAYGISGNTQVGYGNSSVGPHAVLWHGTRASLVDLHPFDNYPEMLRSYATAVDGDTQVGYAAMDNQDEEAMMWHGSAITAVKLHPTGFFRSKALAVSGGLIGGDAWGPTMATYHAFLWKGSADNWVDLNPAGAFESHVTGVSGNREVGYAWFGGQRTHAFVWTGTAASAVDLTPSTRDGEGGNMTCICGDLAGGYIVTIDQNLNTRVDTVIWDLANNVKYFLPPPTGAVYTNISVSCIDADGNAAGWVGNTTGNFAVIWKPIRTITGTVTLQNFNGSIGGMPVTIELRSAGSSTPLETHSVQLDGSGNFIFTTNLQHGTYDIAIKASHWLRKTVSNQSVGIFGASGVNASLVNGDVNGDNSVTLGDFARLRAAFGSTSLSANWDPAADLNGDGVVSLGDFAILRAHFGEQGDQ